MRNTWATGQHLHTDTEFKFRTLLGPLCYGPLRELTRLGHHPADALTGTMRQLTLKQKKSLSISRLLGRLSITPATLWTCEPYNPQRTSNLTLQTANSWTLTPKPRWTPSSLGLRVKGFRTLQNCQRSFEACGYLGFIATGSTRSYF